MSRSARVVSALLTGVVVLSGVALVFRYSWFRDVALAADADAVVLTAPQGVLTGLAWTLCGLVVLWRTGNRVGWISILVGVCFGLQWIGWAIWALERGGQPTMPIARFVGAFLESSWFPAMVLMTVFLPLLFPTGRLLSHRWKWVAVIGVVTFLGFSVYVSVMLLSGTYLDALADDSPWTVLFLLPLLVGTGGSVASMVIRFRGGGSVERQQIKLVVVSLIVVSLILLLLFFDLLATALGPTLGPLIAFGSFALVPLAIATSILRYKLYDIDRLISRTITYGLVVGSLTAVYALVAVGLPQLLGLESADSPLLVAGATLAAAGLFNPLRRRIQALVDRRFNRARYNAQREVEVFAGRLRDAYSIDEITTDMLGLVSKTMAPKTMGLWLRS